MLIVETIAKIRRSVFFRRQVDQGDLPRAATVAEGCPQGHPDRVDSAPYERTVQPRPKLGQWTAVLEELLEANAAKADPRAADADPDFCLLPAKLTRTIGQSY